MDIKLIVARDRNGAIGKKGDMPWKLSSDLRYFKRVTSGNVVIMGYNTYYSLGMKALPNRENIIVSSHHDMILKLSTIQQRNLHVASTLSSALVLASNPLFVMASQSRNVLQDNYSTWIIGGSLIYGLALQNNFVDEAHVTEVNTVVEDPDVFFKYQFTKDKWKVVKGGSNDVTIDNPLEYQRFIYTRK